MKTRRTRDKYGLSHDHIGQLVQIARDESGDELSREDFVERMLVLFEDIAGFECLPPKRCQEHLRILWQSYESACRAPK